MGFSSTQENHMDLEIILIYSFCFDLLKLFKDQNDSQCKMNTAEVMTVVIIAGLYFGGNQALARRFLSTHKYIPKMLSESRLNRRLHKIDPAMWQIVFNSLKTLLKQSANLLEYVVDSFPIQACAKARSYRCKLLSGKHFIGSQITRLFPKSIHATTRKGFLLKILLFIISFFFAYQYFNTGSSLDT
jgi:hypothetical protein